MPKKPLRVSPEQLRDYQRLTAADRVETFHAELDPDQMTSESGDPAIR